ncbi:hypothetical protein BH10BAC5_BH10BAC5_21000 [soil metagenome]
MDELINLVSQKAGISPEQAKTAVDSVVTFIKGKLPEGISSQVDSFINGTSGGDSGNIVGDLMNKAGDLFK